MHNNNNSRHDLIVDMLAAMPAASLFKPLRDFLGEDFQDYPDLFHVARGNWDSLRSGGLLTVADAGTANVASWITSHLVPLVGAEAAARYAAAVGVDLVAEPEHAEQTEQTTESVDEDIAAAVALAPSFDDEDEVTEQPVEPIVEPTKEPREAHVWEAVEAALTASHLLLLQRLHLALRGAPSDDLGRLFVRRYADLYAAPIPDPTPDEVARWDRAIATLGG